MNRRPAGSIPSSRQISRYVTELGHLAKKEYFAVRDRYKRKGLEAREAVERAYVELKIKERYEDLRDRKAFGDATEAGVPLTPEEIREVMPSYNPLAVTKAEKIGDAEMSLSEQVGWAKKWAARVANGEKEPTSFPSDGALFWFQAALSNRREFEKVVLRVDSPTGGEESLYLQEGQHQMKEIEAQLKEAVRECGEKLCAMEGGFAEMLKESVHETA